MDCTYQRLSDDGEHSRRFRFLNESTI